MKHAWLILAALCIIFLAVKLPQAGYSLSDENTYFLMAQRVFQGEMPYRDFFYAHPPLHLFLLSVPFLFAEVPFLALKLLPSLFTVGTAILLFSYLRRKSDQAAIIGTSLFLFSYTVLRATSFGTGLSEACFFLMLGLFFEKKPFLAGAALAVAIFFRYHALIIVAALCLMQLLKRRWKMTAAAVSITALLFLLCLLLFGQAFFADTVQYHLLKQGGEPSPFLRLVIVNPLLWIASLLSLARLRPGNIEVAAIAYLAFLLILQQSFNFYYLPLFLLFAILAGNLAAKVKSKALVTAVFGIAAISGILSAGYFLTDWSQAFPNAPEVAAFVRGQPGDLFGDDYSVPLVALLSQKKIALGMSDINPQMFSTGMLDTNNVIGRLQQGSTIVSDQDDYSGGSFWWGVPSFPAFVSFLKTCELKKEFVVREGVPRRMIRVYWCGPQGH
ncbi:MAG: hypothetical protein V1735_07095 [Nanoarchaeota archaeon]